MSIIDGKEKIKVGKFVSQSLHELFLQKEIPNELLQMLQDADYSKEQIGSTYPLLIEIDEDINSNVIISGSSRYWTSKPVKINNREFFICNDWYEGLNRNNRTEFVKWFLQIEHKLKDKT